ncbi:MAG: pyruvate ferredoxin oxidoreductase [Gemmatimonadetes bacterium]|nr:pyruvate ferredoxin oxidoreductase [Gemmatimonadota bacterium]
MPKVSKRPKPLLIHELCKGCGRCIESCPKHCIVMGDQINQLSGQVPVVIDLEDCNGCNLCIDACPEPYGLVQEDQPYELSPPPFDRPELTQPAAIPDESIPLSHTEPLVLKGNFAAAVGAVLGGCRHVFGYPITPSTEGAEYMAGLLPRLDGVFLQAISEVATVNHMYGCGAAGLPSLTFTSSPGFSLMLEGISYMVGAELPGVFIDVMRGGPGLGNIAPEQGDIKLACRGLGHGNTYAIVFAPTTPQEMLDLTMEAVRLSFEYRNPVVVLADGYLGQMTGRVTLPKRMVKPGRPSWAVWGDAAHRGNLISSILLNERDQEIHNEHLVEKYERMKATEQRSRRHGDEKAEILVMACNTPTRMAKGAVETLRREGMPLALFQPVTLWPFPIDALAAEWENLSDLVVVEASNGQLEDELRLALHHAELSGVRIHNLRHMGGVLPTEAEIIEKVRFVAGERS